MRTAPTRRIAARRSHQHGYATGYRQGVQSGYQHYGTIFDGTSIIIPTCNQLGLLRKCLESIERHTDTPYEIIVIDNASTDGTARYLDSLRGLVRSRLLETNKGFATAVNTGLMMAKGTTMVLLNDDILVTDHWLHNMLVCLNSDPTIGMVGPVTNYISGEQQILVPYRRIAEMPAYARKHNHSDPAFWRDTEWLRGFCLLFRRELFESIGYWDEGFEIGNYEDNDYNIRVRLAGKRLVIAADTFIHHFDSVSIRAIGSAIAESNNRNESYYLAKWNDAGMWEAYVNEQRGRLESATLPDEAARAAAGADLYPQWVAIQGIGPVVYWIENGKRHPIDGDCSIPVVQVSQVDLRRWPAADPIGADDAWRRWHGLEHPSGLQAGIVRQPDGSTWHIENHELRQVISLTALESWQLHLKTAVVVESAMLLGMPFGLPIIALPRQNQKL